MGPKVPQQGSQGPKKWATKDSRRAPKGPDGPLDAAAGLPGAQGTIKVPLNSEWYMNSEKIA